jgi:hypothetical protein
MNNKEVLSKQDVYYVAMIFFYSLEHLDSYFYNLFLGFGMVTYFPTGYRYLKHSIHNKRKMLIDYKQ